jgi:hypothetical protein
MTPEQITDLSKKIVGDERIACFWEYLNRASHRSVMAEMHGVLSSDFDAHTKAVMLRSIIINNSGDWYRATLDSQTADWERLIESYKGPQQINPRSASQPRQQPASQPVPQSVPQKPKEADEPLEKQRSAGKEDIVVPPTPGKKTLSSPKK